MKNKAEYAQYITKFSKEIAELKDKEAHSFDEITKTKLKIKDIQTELEQINSSITVNQKQIY